MQYAQLHETSAYVFIANQNATIASKRVVASAYHEYDATSATGTHM
jgi:hypothetical protein